DRRLRAQRNPLARPVVHGALPVGLRSARVRASRVRAVESHRGTCVERRIAMDPLREPYVRDVLRTFRNSKTLAEKALAQVGDDQLHALIDRDSNSLAVIIKHIG